jgi:1-aminocyclopropane-1-carboxylate synthase
VSDNRCYPRATIIELMRLCQRYQLHLLSDEIYALTTYSSGDFKDPVQFTSLLSMDTTDIIDPSLCHVIHGMSKVTTKINLTDTRTSVPMEYVARR